MDREVIRAYTVPFVFGLVSLLFLIISIILMMKIARPVDPIQFTTASDSMSTGSAQLAIDIQGAVVSPGLYYLPIGSRVEDLLIKAGGIAAEADDTYLAKSLNRASLLRDGMKIYIPTQEEVLRGDTSHNLESSYRSIETSYNDYNQVSVNGASAGELEALSGIGPATSAKIIAGRPYGSIDELVTKKILSKNLFEKLKKQLTL